MQRLRAQGQLPAAQALVAAALARNPPPAERMLWLEQAAQIFTQLGQHAAARAAMLEITSLPGYADSPFLYKAPSFLADSYLAQGARDAAVSVLVEALADVPAAASRTPQALELRHKLAVTRFSTGDYTRAAEELLALLDAPDFPRRRNAFNLLARLYAVEELTDLQLDRLLGRLRPEERDYEFLSILADAYRDREKDKEAVEIYLEIARRYPETLVSALAYMGPFLAQSGQLGDLEAVVRQEHSRRPDHAPTILLLSRVLVLGGKTEEALELLGASADPRLRRERAELLLGERRFAQAAQALEGLLADSPFDPTLIEKLGAAYLAQDEKEKALATWRKLVEGPATTSQSFQTLSDIYQRHGFTQEAVEALRQARGRFPAARNSTMSMAYLWLVQGDYPRALQAFSEYVLVVGESFEFINNTIFQYIRGEAEQEDLLAALRQLYRASGQYNPAQRAWLRDLSRQLLVKLGRYEEALVETEKTAENPGQEFYSLATLYEQSGAPEWAVQAYQKVGRQASVNQPSMLLRVAQLQQNLGRPQEARESLAAASAALTAHDGALAGEILLKEAELLLALKQPGPALALLTAADATAALAGNPAALESAQLMRGEAYSMLGSLPRARQELLPLENSNQRNLRLLARFQLGNIHLWQNQPEEAVAYFQDLLENELGHELANDVLDLAVSAKLYSPEQMAHYSLALLYAWQGRADDAIEEWRILAALAGEGDLAAHALEAAGSLYAASGELEAASGEFGKALRFAASADLVGRIRWSLLEDVAGPRVGGADREEYEQLILDFPDTLFADLARRKLRKEAPETPVEPRP